MQQQTYLEMISILSRKHFKFTLNLSFLVLLSIVHVLQIHQVIEKLVSYFYANFYTWFIMLKKKTNTWITLLKHNAKYADSTLLIAFYLLFFFVFRLPF